MAAYQNAEMSVNNPTENTNVNGTDEHLLPFLSHRNPVEYANPATDFHSQRPRHLPPGVHRHASYSFHQGYDPAALLDPNGPRTAPLLPTTHAYPPPLPSPHATSQPNSPHHHYRDHYLAHQQQGGHVVGATDPTTPSSAYAAFPPSPRPRYAYVPPSGPISPSRLHHQQSLVRSHLVGDDESSLPSPTFVHPHIQLPQPHANHGHIAHLQAVPEKQEMEEEGLRAPALPTDAHRKPRSPAHAATQAGTGTPFIAKLLHLLNNEKYQPYIRWNAKGDAFILSHTNQYFAQNILPLLFRHSNTSSFIRQLNMYGFTRLPIMQLLEAIDDSATPGSLGTGVNASTSCYSGFAHPLFKRNQEELSWLIKPKAATSRNAADAGVLGHYSGHAHGSSQNHKTQSKTSGSSKKKHRSSASKASSSSKRAARTIVQHPSSSNSASANKRASISSASASANPSILRHPPPVPASTQSQPQPQYFPTPLDPFAYGHQQNPMPLPTSSPTSVPYTGASHHHNTRHSQVQQPMHAVSTYDQDEAEMRARELSDLNQALELHARQQAERDQVQNRLDGGTQADVEMSKGESGGTMERRHETEAPLHDLSVAPES